MLKTVSLLFAVTFCLTTSFSQSYEINGFVENKSSGLVFLYCYDEKGNAINNKATITDHRFSFKGKFTTGATQASLSINGQATIEPFYLDTGKIDIKLKADTVYREGKAYKGLTLTSIEGSHNQKIWDETVEHLGKISRCEAPDSVKSEDDYALLLALVKKYPQLYVTRRLLFYKNTLSYTQLKNLLGLLPQKQKETPLGQSLQKRLARLKETQANRFIFFPTQKNTEGKEISVDQLEFKYLLIDFWASWCAPCRAEHPAMKSLYEKYKTPGFEILSIALDDTKEKWIRAIREDQLTWQQTSDLKGFKTEIAEHYGILSIPYNMLIDRSGRIIATGLRGEKLRQKIKELMK